MPVRHQLPVRREPLERLALPLRVVAVDVVEHRRLEHEERAVDPALAGLRLLGELDDLVAVELEVTEARRRPDGGDRRELPVRAVELEQRVEIDVRDAVTPGQHEGLVAEVTARAA